MNYERDNLLLPVPEQAPVDRDLLGSLAVVISKGKETYKELSVSDERKPGLIELLHEGCDVDLLARPYIDLDDNSSLSYYDKLKRKRSLANTEIDQRLLSLRDWKKSLLDSGDIDMRIKRLYRWKINELIANTRMLQVSSRTAFSVDFEKSPERRSKGFQRLNEFIYGKPNEQIYRAALDWIANDADELISKPDQNPAVLSAAKKVADLLKDKRGHRELIVPDEEIFEAVKSDHNRSGGFYGIALSGVDIPKSKITKEIGDPILNHVIKNNLQSDYKIKDAKGSTWSISHSEKAVERPVGHNLPYKRYIGLALGHEVLSHLLEKVNGDRGPVALASVGFPRYESGNEGRAVVREQVVYDTFDEFGKQLRWRDILRRHIAISYACGVGEDRQKRSSEVYEFINTVDMMYQIKANPDDIELATEKARKATDGLILRVLKGTDGQGGAYLKDKVYLEGHVACWMNAALNGAKVISDGDLGKFDINNPDHIALLKDFGLLPDNE